MAKPLRSLRVLDLSRLLPGGYCTQLLADLGAEVIKIEQPELGDYMRIAPPLLNGTSVGHLIINRNKKSLSLNLKTVEGRRIFRALCRKADIVVEGFRPGVAKRLKADYGAIRRINPQIIYCSVTAFGQESSYSSLPAHDLNIMAMSGMLRLLGLAKGSGRIPEVQVADLAGGMFAAIAILAAVCLRQQTGVGQFIDMSMLGGMVAWQWMQAAQLSAEKKSGRKEENILSGSRPFYHVYRTKDDKEVAIAAVEPWFWEKLCKAVGREDFVPDQFADGARRKEIFRVLRRAFRSKTQREWFALLGDACCTPVLESREVLADPTVRERGVIIEQRDREYGSILYPGLPFRLMDLAEVQVSTAPRMGQHTEEILGELGCSAQELSRLRAKGVV